MDDYNSQGRRADSDMHKGQRSRARMILYLILFIVGVGVGIAGLCAAVKFIFYVGLVVTIAAAVAIVIGIFVAKNKIEQRIDERRDGSPDAR